MIEKILQDIKKDFTEEDVCIILDEEILNWVEDDWPNEFDDEYEWYSAYGRGEAENVIINQMINHWVDKYNKGKKLNVEDNSKLFEKIKGEYYPLGHS